MYIYYLIRQFIGYLTLIIITQPLIASCRAMLSQHSRIHVLGGVRTDFRDFPGYMVKIKFQIGRQSATCSGVHVGDGVILTASHCLFHNLDQKSAQTKWKPGLYNLQQITYLSKRKSGTVMPRNLSTDEIVMAVYHHNFPHKYYDLGVIFTKPKVPFGDTALLPDKDYTHQSRAVTVYGVGLSFTDLYHSYHSPRRYFSGDASIDVESKYNLETYHAYSRSQGHRSQKVHRWLMDATTLMPPMSFFISIWNHPESASSAIQGICPGDSGGPVVLRRSERDMVIGTLSHVDAMYMLYQGKIKEFFDITSVIEGCIPFIAVNHLFEYLPWLREVIRHYRKIDHTRPLRSEPISLSSEQLKNIATKQAKH